MCVCVSVSVCLCVCVSVCLCLDLSLSLSLPQPHSHTHTLSLSISLSISLCAPLCVFISLWFVLLCLLQISQTGHIYFESTGRSNVVLLGRAAQAGQTSAPTHTDGAGTTTMIDADDGVVAAMASWIKWPTSWAVARDTAAECAQGLRVMWRELADFGCREGTDVQAWQQQRLGDLVHRASRLSLVPLQTVICTCKLLHINKVVIHLSEQVSVNVCVCVCTYACAVSRPLSTSPIASQAFSATPPPLADLCVGVFLTRPSLLPTACVLPLLPATHTRACAPTCSGDGEPLLHTMQRQRGCRVWRRRHAPPRCSQMPVRWRRNRCWRGGVDEARGR